MSPPKAVTRSQIIDELIRSDFIIEYLDFCNLASSLELGLPAEEILYGPVVEKYHGLFVWLSGRL